MQQNYFFSFIFSYFALKGLFISYWFKNLVISQPLTGKLFINEVWRKGAVSFKVRMWNTFQSELPQIWNTHVGCKMAPHKVVKYLFQVWDGQFQVFGDCCKQGNRINLSSKYLRAIQNSLLSIQDGALHILMRCLALETVGVKYFAHQFLQHYFHNSKEIWLLLKNQYWFFSPIDSDVWNCLVYWLKTVFLFSL